VSYNLLILIHIYVQTQRVPKSPRPSYRCQTKIEEKSGLELQTVKTRSIIKHNFIIQIKKFPIDFHLTVKKDSSREWWFWNILQAHRTDICTRICTSLENLSMTL